MPNRIDQTRPIAPELAFPGPHGVGVRTLDLVHLDQVDVVQSTDRLVRHDRVLTVELWYPAAPGTGAVRPYATLLRDGQRPVVLHGSAFRDAVPVGRHPLVILSHGYPGNRHHMAHFGEKLASHGYVVASIDHRDSTYADKAPLASTLVNRPLDTEFVRAALGDWAEIGRTAIIGYSMGGYGALVSAGAGINPEVLEMEGAPQFDLWRPHLDPVVNPALKAIIPIGPWGRQRALWTAKGLAGVRVPMLVMAGSADGISGYETGMRRIFEEATGVRRHLLTFVNAGHNAAAPYPAPEEAFQPSPALEFHPFEHYADPVWDSLAMNNIAQHFARAFLDLHLKDRQEQAEYLTDAFKGFAPGTARGLMFESLG